MNEITLNICNWCGQPSIIIWVHGHGQCSVCGINVDECCRGEEFQSIPNFLIKEEKEKLDND